MWSCVYCTYLNFKQTKNDKVTTVEASWEKYSILQTSMVLFPNRANKDLLPSSSLSVFLSLSKHIIHHSHKQQKTAGSLVSFLPQSKSAVALMQQTWLDRELQCLLAISDKVDKEDFLQTMFSSENNILTPLISLMWSIQGRFAVDWISYSTSLHNSATVFPLTYKVSNHPKHCTRCHTLTWLQCVRTKDVAQASALLPFPFITHICLSNKIYKCSKCFEVSHNTDRSL